MKTIQCLTKIIQNKKNCEHQYAHEKRIIFLLFIFHTKGKYSSSFESLTLYGSWKS